MPASISKVTYKYDDDGVCKKRNDANDEVEL
jgi:hypothetical protein